MAVPSNSGGSSASKLIKSDQKEKISNNETKCPEQSVNGGPENGGVGVGTSSTPNWKTCHQCRQRTKYFAAACRNQKQNKPCPIRFCHKCLLNRYGEKAEQVSVLEDWKCPKCRGICNCSICMKKRGQHPTGILVHTAKATGFSSVSEMLQIKGHETIIGHEKNLKDMGVSPKKLATPNKEPAGDTSRKRGRENSLDMNLALNSDEKKAKKMKRGGLKKLHGGNSDHGVLDSRTIVDDGDQPKKVLESCKPKTKRVAEKFQTIDVAADIRLPQGKELTTVAGIDLLPQDVGHALQFLEFCAAFGEILQLNKGQPESIIRDIIRGRSGRGGRYSSAGQFHVQLLSLIEKDLGKKPPILSATNGKNSWLHVLKKRISASQCASNEFPFDTDADAYDRFDSSIKLRLLNFLCDEILSTDEIRIWIEDQNSKIDEKLKEAKENLLAAKNKEKSFRQKLQDKMAEAIIAKNGAVLSISEQEAIFSQVKTEAAQAHAEMLESKGVLSKMEEERCDAVRTEPILLGIDGRAYWRLKGCFDNSDILLQDMGTWNAVAKGDRWFTFDDKQKKMIEKHINSSRDRKLKSQNFAVPSETRETKP